MVPAGSAPSKVSQNSQKASFRRSLHPKDSSTESESMNEFGLATSFGHSSIISKPSRSVSKHKALKSIQETSTPLLSEELPLEQYVQSTRNLPPHSPDEQLKKAASANGAIREAERPGPNASRSLSFFSRNFGKRVLRSASEPYQSPESSGRCSESSSCSETFGTTESYSHSSKESFEVPSPYSSGHNMHRSFDQAPNQAGTCRNSQHRPMSPRCRLLELFSMPLHRHHDTLEKPDISSGSPQLANGQTAQTKEMASVRCHSPLSTSNSGPRSTVLSHFSRSHASGKEPQPSRRALNTDSSPYMAPEIQSPRPLHAKSPMAHPGAISVVSILSPGPRPVERENGALQVTFANDKAPVEPGANDQFVSDPSPSFLRNKKSRTQLHVMTFAPPSHEPSSLVPPLGIKTSTLSPRPDNTRRSFLADTSLESARSKSVASLTSSGSLRSVRPSRSDKRRNFSLGSFHFEGADKKAERTNTSETDVSSPTSSQEHKSSGSKSPVSSSPIEDPIEAGWTLVYLPSSGSLARKSSKASMDPKMSPRLNGDLTLGRSTSMSSHSRSASLRTASHPHFSFETARDVAMSRRT